MPESAPLLDSTDDNAPPIVEAHTNVHTGKTPASAYFRPLITILAFVTFVLSLLTIVLLIATYIIVKNAPLGSSYIWRTALVTKALGIWMSFPLVVSGLSALINFPILLNVLIEIVILACIIPQVVELFGGLPNSGWCQRYYPGMPPVPPKCMDWKLVITILIGFIAGFTILVCIIYVVQLLLRGIAIFRTKLWKRPLSWALPGEITINFSMRVLRQEGENGKGSGAGHGPVYLA